MLDVSAAASLAGTLTLDFSDFVPSAAATYKFLKAGSIIGTFDSFEVIGLNPAAVSFNVPAGEFTVIPEPASLAVLALGGLAIVGRRRK